MIKEGELRRTKYWGPYKVLKVVEIDTPEIAESAETGKAIFKYTLAKIRWSDGKCDFWFPYWVTIKGKERYGQYAPMLSEGSLLNLLQKAINGGFFSKTFLNKLNKTVNNKLNVELKE